MSEEIDRSLEICLKILEFINSKAKEYNWEEK